MATPRAAGWRGVTFSAGSFRMGERAGAVPRKWKMLSSALAALLALAAAVPPALGAWESYAIVQQDGSLKVGGKTFRLYGIYIPDTGRMCRFTIRPSPRCGSEAVVALRFRIQGFVRCEPMHRNPDGSIDAVCYVRGRGSVLEPDEDLAAYLLRRGLAVASPGAPFEYVTLERIAQAQGRGLWSDRLRRIW